MTINVRLFTGDSVWKKILEELGADVSPGGINFTAPEKKLSLCELHEHVEKLSLKRIAELNAQALSDAEQSLLLLLPADANYLKRALGYADDAKTHTVETLIYKIRKKLGQDFVRLADGVYTLG